MTGANAALLQLAKSGNTFDPTAHAIQPHLLQGEALELPIAPLSYAFLFSSVPSVQFLNDISFNLVDMLRAIEPALTSSPA